MLTEHYFKDNSSVEPYEKSPFWTLLGDADDLEKIPFHHREQLLFLNRISSDFGYQYIEDLNVLDYTLKNLVLCSFNNAFQAGGVLYERPLLWLNFNTIKNIQKKIEKTI